MGKQNQKVTQLLCMCLLGMFEQTNNALVISGRCHCCHEFAALCCCLFEHLCLLTMFAELVGRFFLSLLLPKIFGRLSIQCSDRDKDKNNFASLRLPSARKVCTTSMETTLMVLFLCLCCGCGYGCCGTDSLVVVLFFFVKKYCFPLCLYLCILHVYVGRVKANILKSGCFDFVCAQADYYFIHMHSFQITPRTHLV